MLTERTEQLLRAIEHLGQTFEDWRDNRDVAQVTTAFEKGMEDCLALWQDGDLPGDCRELAKLVDVLADEYERYKERVFATGNEFLLPGDTFWNAWAAVAHRTQSLVEPPKRVLEPIAELEKIGCQPAQICEIYDWVDERGRPELWRLHDEKAKPGTHTGANHKTRADREREKKTQRQHEAIDSIHQAMLSRAQRAAAPPPESLQELVSQGLSLRQIAVMHNSTPAAMRDRLQAERLPVPELDYAPLANQRAAAEPDLPEAAARELDRDVAKPTRGRGRPKKPRVAAEELDGLSLEQRVIVLHQRGIAAAQIAAQLSTPDAKLSAVRVEALVARYRQDPSAFGPIEQAQAAE